MLKLIGVSHTYSENTTIECKALNEINISIPLNKFVIVLGQSGSGKTTLLNVLSGLLKPTLGTVEYNGNDIFQYNDKQLSAFRRDNIGFVFQSYFLDSSFSALDNVKVPLFLHKDLTKEDIYSRAKGSLKQVGLFDKCDNKPTQLSGGQCQRVAIARALVNNPKFVIADEPTGNLDSFSGNAIVELLRSQVSPVRSVVMVTHNSDYVKNNDIVYHIKDGSVEKIQ